MGFTAMHHVRHLGDGHEQQRFGITQQAPEAPKPADESPFLKRTPFPSRDYVSPIEWTVCGDELQIINFSDSGSVIRLKEPVVAEAFREIWHLLDKNIRSNTMNSKNKE